MDWGCKHDIQQESYLLSVVEEHGIEGGYQKKREIKILCYKISPNYQDKQFIGDNPPEQCERSITKCYRMQWYLIFPKYVERLTVVVMGP